MGNSLQPCKEDSAEFKYSFICEKNDGENMIFQLLLVISTTIHETFVDRKKKIMYYRENNEFKELESQRLGKISVSVKYRDTKRDMPELNVLRQSKVDKPRKNTSTANPIGTANLPHSKQKFIYKKLDPARISFEKSNLNNLFPLPFIRCIARIKSATQIGQSIRLDLLITENTKTFILHLAGQQNHSDKFGSMEQVDRENHDLSVYIDVTTNKDNNVRSFSIHEERSLWRIYYKEHENYLHLIYESMDIYYSKDEIKNNILSGKVCPYCQCETNEVTDKEIFGPYSNYDKKFIQCKMNRDHYVGTYRNGKSLGRLANLTLRRKKMEAHAIFDPLWKNKIFKSRDAAYTWLSSKMSLPKDETHFGMFDETQCDKAIRLMNRFNKRMSILDSVLKYLKKTKQ
jgi:hypothetical protein